MDKFETYSDARGVVTNSGRLALERAMALLAEFNNGVHEDNCGPGSVCRIDLRGHDCCYICNFAEEVLRKYAEHYE